MFALGKDLTKIYADNVATTKMSGAAINAMTTCMEDTWGNPSSLYRFGQKEDALEDARERIAVCIGASPREIIFTSGGSEADIVKTHENQYADFQSGQSPLAHEMCPVLPM